MMHSGEKGGALLVIVLLLAPALLLLNGLAQQLSWQRQLVVSEIAFIKGYVAAQSALAWGGQQLWRLQQGWQCQVNPGGDWRACVYQNGKGEALLAATQDAASGEALTLWRWGSLRDGRLAAASQGWLDFCPLKESELCRLPR